jgi:hypothetical protein
MQTMTDRLKYKGQFKDGKKSGQGKLMMSDGSFYQGEFVENKI